MPIDKRLRLVLQDLTRELDGQLMRRFGIGEIVTHAFLGTIYVTTVEKIQRHIGALLFYTLVW